MDFDDFSIKASSLLRHAGLAEAPRSAIIGVAVLACALVCIGAWHFWPRPSAEFTVASADQAQETEEALAGVSQEILVDVEGAVCTPGLYSLEADARVGDAIAAAGGLAAGAAPAQVNLARKLTDGEQIYVPSMGENDGSGGEASSSGDVFGSGAVTGAQESVDGKVNINTASSEELQKLSGIGPSLAERIIEYREANGRFSSVDDLQNVSGIGKTRFANIKDEICV